MAQKKTAKRKKTTPQSGVKKQAARRPARKKTAAKKTAAQRKAVKKKAAKKKVAKPQAARKKTSKKKAAAKKPAKRKSTVRKPSLGRPKLTGEALLDQVFKEDFHARQIFTFLRVTTLKELEQFAPEDIVNRLSAPLVQTVQQIRKRLADNNRHLAGDMDYALERKRQRTGK